MAFPTTAVLDDFNRTEDPLSQGGAWSNPTESGDVTLKTNGSTLLLGSGTGYGDAYRTTSVGPDSEVYCTLSTLGAVGTDNVFIYVRVASPGGAGLDGYVMGFGRGAGAADDGWTIFRIDDAAGTQLGAQIVQDVAAGEKIGLEIIGSTIAPYHYNGSVWTQLGTRSDSTYSAAGKIAITFNDVTWRIDNFGGGTVVVTPALATTRYTEFPKPFPLRTPAEVA